MPHMRRRPGDTYYWGGWWYRDADDYLDTKAEYDQPEYREDADRELDDAEDDAELGER